MKMQSLKDFGVRTLTFWGHVTNGLAVVTFLLVVNDDHASILHHDEDIKPRSCVQPMLRAKSLLRMPGVT